MPFPGLCGHIACTHIHTPQLTVTTYHTHSTSPPVAKPIGTGLQANTCTPTTTQQEPTFNNILRAPQQGLLYGGQNQILKLRVRHKPEQGGTVVLERRQKVRHPASGEGHGTRECPGRAGHSPASTWEAWLCSSECSSRRTPAGCSTGQKAHGFS